MHRKQVCVCHTKKQRKGQLWGRESEMFKEGADEEGRCQRDSTHDGAPFPGSTGTCPSCAASVAPQIQEQSCLISSFPLPTAFEASFGAPLAQGGYSRKTMPTIVLIPAIMASSSSMDCFNVESCAGEKGPAVSARCPCNAASRAA